MIISNTDIEQLDKIVYGLQNNQLDTVPELINGFGKFNSGQSTDNTYRFYENFLVDKGFCSIKEGWTSNAVINGFKTLQLDSKGYELIHSNQSIRDFINDRSSPLTEELDKAIRRMEEHKVQIDTFPSEGEGFWRGKVCEDIKKYIGKDTVFYTNIKNQVFTPNQKAEIPESIEGQKRRGRNMIDDIIGYIRTHGLKKEVNPMYYHDNRKTINVSENKGSIHQGDNAIEVDGNQTTIELNRSKKGFVEQTNGRNIDWNMWQAIGAVAAAIIAGIFLIIQINSHETKNKEQSENIKGGVPYPADTTQKDKTDSLANKKNIAVGTIKNVNQSGIQIGDSNKMNINNK